MTSDRDSTDTAVGREPAFVGRLTERDEIRAAFARGEGGVLIVGPAGIGKTRLARVALAGLGEADLEPIWVRGSAAAATIPLAAVLDLLPADVAGADPLRIFQASAEMLRRRAGERRLVLAVDDAHLLDPGSAALVLHLAGKGAFVLATARSEERGPDAVTALWKDVGVRRVQLAALDEAETGQLVERLLGGPVEAVAVRWAHRSGSGNPLYVRELVRDAAETGALERDGSLWRLRLRQAPGPALSELVAERLEGLGEAHRLTLAALAIGEPLPVPIVARLGGAGSLAELDRRGLAVSDGAGAAREARLAHPLYGEVALQQMPGPRLDEVRLLLATAVREGERQPGDALRVAIWLRDAGAPIDAPLLLEAAAEAYRSRDAALAAELAERAERGGGGPPAVLAAGQALAALGRHADAEAMLARLDEDRDSLSPAAAPAYLFARINVLIWGLGESRRAERLVESAADWWDDEDWMRLVRGLRLMVLSAGGKVAAAAAVAAELAGTRDPLVAGLVATSGAIAWLHAGATGRAMAASARALPPAPADERLDDRGIAGLVSWSLARLESGREWDAVQDRVARIERAAVRRDDRIAAGPAAGLLGYLALSRGAARSALRLLGEAAGHLELHDPRGLSVLIEAHTAQAAALLGDGEGAATALLAAEARLAGRGPAWHERPRLAIARAWALAAEGDSTRAVDGLLEAAETVGDWPLLQALMLQEALSLGAPAGLVAPPLEAAAGRCDAPRADAAAHHARALSGGDADRLVAAAEELAAIGAWLVAAEAFAQASARGAAEGRRSFARRAAARGDDLRRRCEGASTPALRATAPGRSSLTRREREIAELAAAGKSNAEIAALLVLSVRTVESHLYHAMAKLAVSDRGELSTALESPATVYGSAQP